MLCRVTPIANMLLLPYFRSSYARSIWMGIHAISVSIGHAYLEIDTNILHKQLMCEYAINNAGMFELISSSVLGK